MSAIDHAILAPGLELLEQGMRPVVVYPAGFPRQFGAAAGKEPFGKRWGIKPVSPGTLESDVAYFVERGYTPGWGVCLGPGRAPDGKALADLEGDGPAAEASRLKLFNGELAATRGHRSARGQHEFFAYDWGRLQAIVAGLAPYQSSDKNQPGVYHLPEYPDLELRLGGVKADGEIKQLQSVVPPTPGSDGRPRDWNGVTTIVDVPEAFYLALECVAASAAAGSRSATNSTSHESRNTHRGNPDRVDAWLKRAMEASYGRIAMAPTGERHATLLRQVRTLAGYLRYKAGFTESELEDAMTEAADKAVPERKGDNRRCVRDAIADGKAEPLDLPDELHAIATGTGPAGPKLSRNGHQPAGNRTARSDSDSDGTTAGDAQPEEESPAGPDGDAKENECDRYIDTGSSMLMLIKQKIDGHEVEVPVRLCQFSGRINQEIVRHESGEQRRQYKVRLTRDAGAAIGEATVEATEFEAMAWVQSQLGPSWIIEPDRGTKDKVRAAIQTFSVRDGYGQRVVSTSLGWFEHEGKQVFLHGGGAIGAYGATDAVGVDLAPALARYRLPDPPSDPEAIRQCFAAHFGLLDLAKAHRPNARGMAATLVTLPPRSILGPIDGVVHYSGGTAVRKTSTARLVLQHFAAGISVKDAMSVSWGATLASLQRYAYDCRGVCLVIDELKGDRAVATATEFIQAQGNLKARDRMDRHLRLAPSLDPRCGVLSTGEADPTSQSTLGRMITVRFGHETVDLDVLTRCQADAAAGLYASLMSGFIQWLAPRLEDVRRSHAALVDELAVKFRKATDGTSVHPRHPTLAAELAAGYRPLLRYALDCGVILPVTAQSYAETIDAYLIELVNDQDESQRESNPAQRFVALLVEGLRALRFHLKRTDSDDAPELYAGACGWKKDFLYQGSEAGQMLDWCIPANSKMVGFIDEKAAEVYMAAESVKTVVQVVARDQGDRYENPTKIGRDLAEAGLLRTSSETDEHGKTKVRNQIKKRIKDHGNSWYYAIPICRLFKLGGLDGLDGQDEAS